MNDELFDLPQFTLPQTEKNKILFSALSKLTEHHYNKCLAYRNIIDALYPQWRSATCLEAIPAMPVGLFKSKSLSSITLEETVAMVTSSGTSGQSVSRVPIDRETAALQSQALFSALEPVLGKKRSPMMVIDNPAVLSDRKQLNARAAGVIGMMRFGRSHIFALDEEMKLDLEGLKKFVHKHSGEPMLLFGFTFMAWAYFLEALRGRGLDLSNSILIHSGGWKTMAEHQVTNTIFKEAFHTETGLSNIYNFYGMGEQIGTIFLEGNDGLLYPPNFADVIIRDPLTHKELPAGETGLIQVLSTIPHSYPGHSLLTEDLGKIHHIDQLDSCGRMGKAFTISGRVPKAEIRGCSDTYAEKI